MKKITWFTSIALLLVVLPALFFYGHFGPHVILTPTSFNNLPGWKQDNHQAALVAYKQSCLEILKRDPKTAFSNHTYTGPNSNWQAPCRAAAQLTDANDTKAKQFFETWFRPYQLKNNYNPHGLFTGYYLPSLAINLNPDKDYTIPIYALPKDLIKIDLGKFKKELTGVIITAQLENTILKPYPDRATITAAPLKNAEIIAWTNNAIDLFFAQIQGSAMGVLPDNTRVLLSYAGGNGRSYKPIGKILLNKKALTRNNISMQSIRAWLEKHPNEISTILNQNLSYNFFQLRKSADVIGTEQVPLTPQRSLAIDRKYIPLGAPLWLSTHYAFDNQQHTFNHLVLAQDTGGAINGIVRGDIYWGTGQQAADIAGHMQDRGLLWILLPRRST